MVDLAKQSFLHDYQHIKKSSTVALHAAPVGDRMSEALEDIRSKCDNQMSINLNPGSGHSSTDSCEKSRYVIGQSDLFFAI